MPFRTAHEVSAQSVRYCIEHNINLEEMPLEEYKKISDLIENDVYEVLPPKACAFIRETTGGPSPVRVKEQIQDLNAFVKSNSQGMN